MLRALVCRLGAGRSQWSILSLGKDEAALVICSGMANSTAAARRTAASEIAKCLENAIAESAPETASEAPAARQGFRPLEDRAAAE
jgi:hypothetical protein